MEKLKLAIIASILAYGIYQLFMGSPLLFATCLFAVIVFLVIFCGFDIFDGNISMLSTLIVVFTVIHVVRSSNAPDIENTKTIQFNDAIP